MGLYVRKRIYTSPNGDAWMTLSRSGVSASHRVGRHAVVNTRGNVFIRTGIPGVYFRFNMFRTLFRGKK